ncbi:hypothetical protein B0G69_7544 [Paraburkholderia sp. RAU2J]|uniref:hypothetical protein n=1 Tax=Paraburkholderia sp. RAU2J TaxID=1938810 RepID=UPI000EB18111|nr:hypothetical protein [Paraburkholderia sp. RAU2J]RKT14295.1 hypothetical protein B0G69_7544 [Paraburkholderia sp. RAU2J]
MASQWGSNSLAPGSSAGWFFVRQNVPGFLPVLQVMPLTSSSTDALWALTGGGYPYFNQLGISTIWSQLTDDLANVVYFIVVQNNSNNVIEYAFLEADVEVPPAAVAAPSGGLGSNSNYFLSNCNGITGLQVDINVTQDITGSDGFGFQVNAYSGSGAYDGAQQYLIYLDPNSSPPQLYCMVDNWQTGSTQLINNIVSLATLPSHTLPAGYQLSITLQNDASGNITGATYVATDNNGNTIGSQTISLPSLTLVSGGPVTSADLAPIVSFQLDFVDYLNGGTTTLSSGAGTITYTASEQMTVLSSEPSCVDWDYSTVEAANSIYGPMPPGASQTFVQSFTKLPTGAIIRKLSTVNHVTRPTP